MAVKNTDFSQEVRNCMVQVQTVICVDHTVDEALTSLRERHIDKKIIYFYVVDKENHLEGVVAARDLLLKDPNLPISDVMQRCVVRIYGDQPLEKAMEMLAHHHLLALPVVDERQRLIGSIDVRRYLEESVDVVDSRFRNDVFQMIGITLEEGRKKTAWKSYRLRMPWIFCNLIGGIACAVISRMFAEVLASVILLAMFIPLVLTLSESISMQSMTQSLQLLRKHRLFPKKIWYQIFRDMKVAGLIAATCGFLVGTVSLLWGGGILPGITIASSIIIGVSVSAFVGTATPLLLHIRKLDPKVSSGPIVLMFADVLSTAVYLCLATWWLL